jgi:hypothetical protein
MAAAGHDLKKSLHVALLPMALAVDKGVPAAAAVASCLMQAKCLDGELNDIARLSRDAGHSGSATEPQDRSPYRLSDRLIVCNPPTARRRSLQALEDSREMGLRLKPNVKGDIDQGLFVLQKQFLGPLDSPPQDVVARTQTRRCTKPRCKVHSAKASGLSQVVKRDGPVNMMVDVGRHAL